MKKQAEEFIWVEGYKGTDSNMCCKGYQYELNKQFDMPENEEIKCCESGFHLCLNLEDVFVYYDIGNGNRFFKVKALVRNSEYDRCTSVESPFSGYSLYICGDTTGKLTSKSIIFERELSAEEVFKPINYGECESWTTEQKEKALATSITTVQNDIQIDDLCSLGYSNRLAKYIVQHKDYELAASLASQEGLLIDTTIRIIFNN